VAARCLAVFPLPARPITVEELLDARGIIVSHKTLRQRASKFAQHSQFPKSYPIIYQILLGKSCLPGSITGALREISGIKGDDTNTETGQVFR
jgi:hypothetical protein